MDSSASNREEKGKTAVSNISGGFEHTPPAARSWLPQSSEGPLLLLKVELNILWWVMMVLGFLVRFWRLDFPCYVV